MVVLQAVMEVSCDPLEVATTARHVLHSSCVCKTSSLLNPNKVYIAEVLILFTTRSSLTTFSWLFSPLSAIMTWQPPPN